jgi:archaellum component FlaC
MSNIMQYLLTMSDEFRDSYEDIKKQNQLILDSLELLEQRVSEIETRINPNRQD